MAVFEAISGMLADGAPLKRVATSRVSCHEAANLISIAELERLLHAGLRVPSQLEIVRSGARVPAARYVDVKDSSSVDPDLAVALYRSGCCLVFNGIHHLARNLGELARSLEVSLGGADVHANMYLGSSNGSCFEAHADEHDVVVVQCAGSKKWRVAGECEQSPPAFDSTLRAGDILCIPSGRTHQAFEMDGPSLHLTLGITLIGWQEVLGCVVSEYVQSLAAGDRVPLLSTELARASMEHLGRLLDEDLVEVAIAQCRERYVRTRRPMVHGLLNESVQGRAPASSPRTPFSARTTAVWTIRQDGDEMVVCYHRKEIRLPNSTGALLDRLMAGEPVTAEDACRTGPLTPENALEVLNLLRDQGLLVQPS